MKCIKITIVVLALIVSAIAQAPKDSLVKPNLPQAFANTGVNALVAIGDFKGTGSLTGLAKNAYESASSMASPSSEPERLMVANLRDFAIMRSTDNLAREKIVLQLKKAPKDPELSLEFDSMNKRESECLTALKEAFRSRIAIPLPGMCTK